MPSKKSRKSYVPEWIKIETPHVRRALETASRHFDRDDVLDVHTLEAMYGEESSFGRDRRTRNIKKDDERFDLNKSSAAAAKYLKSIDNNFRKQTVLTKNIKTISV